MARSGVATRSRPETRCSTRAEQAGLASVEDDRAAIAAVADGDRELALVVDGDDRHPSLGRAHPVVALVPARIAGDHLDPTAALGRDHALAGDDRLVADLDRVPVVGADEAAHLRRGVALTSPSLGPGPTGRRGAPELAEPEQADHREDREPSLGCRRRPLGVECTAMATSRTELALRRRRRRAQKKPRRRGRVELANVVDEVIRLHVPEEVQRLSRIRNLWIRLFPVSFADHVWPMLVAGGRLVVHVQDSQWLHEMAYWRQEVVTRLRAAWPEVGIEIIEAYVGPLPPLLERRPPPPPEPPPVDRTPALDPEVPPETLAALNAVQDPKLRDALAQARMMLGKPRGLG